MLLLSEQRYQHYLDHGVDDVAVASIKEEWRKNSYARAHVAVIFEIPACCSLRLDLVSTRVDQVDPDRVKELVREMLAEMKRDYIISVKRTILDYVTRAPAPTAAGADESLLVTPCWLHRRCATRTSASGLAFRFLLRRRLTGEWRAVCLVLPWSGANPFRLLTSLSVRLVPGAW